MTDADRFDDLVAQTDPATIVVTTASHGRPAGCLVGFHSQCSIEPRRYCVWISKANFTYGMILPATHFAVHLLGVGDHDLAALFGGTTGDEFDKFAECDWTPGAAGVPLLTRCPNRMVLERTTLHDDGGDHVCVVGAPVDVHDGTTPVPMRTSYVDDIDAGHEATESSGPSSPAAETAGTALRSR